MPTLSDLASVLIGCRVVSRARWEKAVETGEGELSQILNVLTAQPPDWWDRKIADTPKPPPGLTEYQRDVIEYWFAGGEGNLARQLARNQFLLLEKLGQGGQGEVYRSRQLNPPRFVAVKTLIQDTESGRQRFEQEARAMMKIQHPAVARFYLYERVRDAAGKPTDEYLIAMEVVEGIDLNRLVRESGPVFWPFVAKWAVDLLGGLAVIHKHGFIHRDLKPANVMILGRSPEFGAAPLATSAKLLDFGAVKHAEDSAPVEGSTGKRIFVGTREYAPPEQWGSRVITASDLYALGGSLFYALTGQPPYVIEGRDPIAFMKAHERAPVPDVRQLNPDVPEELNQLLQKMMAKNPYERGTSSELLDEFRALIPQTKPTTSSPARTARPAAPTPLRPPTPSESEPHSPVYRALDPVLAALERVFIPGHLRPPPGEEPAIYERVAALLRRPLVLLILAVFLGLFIFLLWR
ncbi:MAG: serine/threonine protein kinase [Planctomycetia bacterium]|nr:serine/threonine protein kinase [Planctomycetia bacterium]